MNILESYKYIRKITSIKPKYMISLGYKLKNIEKYLVNPIFINYKNIPGFELEEIKGYKNKLIMGYIENIPVVFFNRYHFYENHKSDTYHIIIKTLNLLGANILICINSSSSLTQKIKPGNLVIIKDHINLQSRNPLTGFKNFFYRNKFINMHNTYNQKLISNFLLFTQNNFKKVVYVGVSGPYFETFAESVFYRKIGADIIGMSIIPEVIVARFYKIKIFALSLIINYSPNCQKNKNIEISHNFVLEKLNFYSKKIIQIIIEFIKYLKC